jgi:hypothetical protein
MNEGDDLRERVVEARHEVADAHRVDRVGGGGEFGLRAEGVSDVLATDAGPVGAPQDVAGHTEQPHPRGFGLARQTLAAAPRDLDRLREQVGAPRADPPLEVAK